MFHETLTEIRGAFVRRMFEFWDRLRCHQLTQQNRGEKKLVVAETQTWILLFHQHVRSSVGCWAAGLGLHSGVGNDWYVIRRHRPQTIHLLQAQLLHTPCQLVGERRLTFFLWQDVKNPQKRLTNKMSFTWVASEEELRICLNVDLIVFIRWFKERFAQICSRNRLGVFLPCTIYCRWTFSCVFGLTADGELFDAPPPHPPHTHTHDAAEHTVAPHRPKTSSEGKTYQGINTKLFSDSPQFHCCILSNSLQTFMAFSGPFYQVYPQFSL